MIPTDFHNPFHSFFFSFHRRIELELGLSEYGDCREKKKNSTSLPNAQKLVFHFFYGLVIWEDNSR